jgi:ABC-2 type transport system permease protein
MIIFNLTLAQLTLRRRYLIVLVLAAVPILLSGIYWFSDPSSRPDLLDFHDVMTEQVLNSVVLPIAALLLATATLGDEVEDRTLNYLTMKPISRWKIVIPKFVATLIGVGVPVVSSGIVMSLLITEGDIGTSLATGAGLAVGAAAYSVVFMWGGLVSRQAIAFGLVYVFLWEVSISTLFAGLRYLSVRQYTLGVIRGLDDQRLQDAGGLDLTLVPALVGALVVVVLFTWLTDRRLRLMDIP